MKLVKLTKKAQDIVNQIMSADAVDVDHGSVGERIAYGNMHLTGEGLEFNVNVDGDIGEMTITNDMLNAAEIVDGFIEIDGDKIENNEYGSMTISLYTLQSLSAKN